MRDVWSWFGTRDEWSVVCVCVCACGRARVLERVLTWVVGWSEGMQKRVRRK